MKNQIKFNDDLLLNVFRKSFLALGILAAAGLVGYGLSYIIVMPKISPDGFVPKTPGTNAGNSFGFGTVLAAFILLYSFAFLPVNIMFTVKKFNTNPYALVLANCLIVISLIIEIINNLPLVALGIYPGKVESISPDVLLYFRQIETIRYLSLDVAGFTLGYLAFFIYAIVYFKTHRLLSYTILGSIVIFILNVPFLWFAPNIAIILMVISIFACAIVPIFQAKMAVE